MYPLRHRVSKTTKKDTFYLFCTGHPPGTRKAVQQLFLLHLSMDTCQKSQGTCPMPSICVSHTPKPLAAQHHVQSAHPKIPSELVPSTGTAQHHMLNDRSQQAASHNALNSFQMTTSQSINLLNFISPRHNLP